MYRYKSEMEKVMREKKDISKIRRNNARLYPIYKMFSWDLLFFYSIEFLFLTITKKLTASEILIIDGFYLLFKIIMQIPAVAINDLLGKRKSMILGNIFVSLYIIVLIACPGVISVIIADFICAIGFDIKAISESNLLYDSVATRGGEGLYSKLDAKGRKFILCFRWNGIFNSRIFVCYKWLYTNVCLFRFFYYFYNIIF